MQKALAFTGQIQMQSSSSSSSSCFSQDYHGDSPFSAYRFASRKFVMIRVAFPF